MNKESAVKTGTLWLHPKQEKGLVRGTEIYEFLKKNDKLKYCVRLDTLEFYKKHPKKIPKEWREKWVYAWNDVVNHKVPFLCCDFDPPPIYWLNINYKWCYFEPTFLIPMNKESLQIT